jgi:hypothetical protein
MSGSGPRWAAIEKLFEIHVRRLGLNPREHEKREPRAEVQGDLFGA